MLLPGRLLQFSVILSFYFLRYVRQDQPADADSVVRDPFQDLQHAGHMVIVLMGQDQAVQAADTFVLEKGNQCISPYHSLAGTAPVNQDPGSVRPHR